MPLQLVRAHAGERVPGDVQVYGFWKNLMHEPDAQHVGGRLLHDPPAAVLQLILEKPAANVLNDIRRGVILVGFVVRSCGVGIAP
jgi:hypothetical protein